MGSVYLIVSAYREKAPTIWASSLTKKISILKALISTTCFQNCSSTCKYIYFYKKYEYSLTFFSSFSSLVILRSTIMGTVYLIKYLRTNYLSNVWKIDILKALISIYRLHTLLVWYGFSLFHKIFKMAFVFSSFSITNWTKNSEMTFLA